MAIVTLMTDFGIKDGNVGVMKGVILGIAPQSQLVDLSHTIAPQNVREAALILARSAPFFQAGTVHIVVVDPGVGTARRPVAVRLGEQYYVGPDNGTLTLWLERAERAGETVEAVALDRPQFWLPDVSYVFHGRDIFAPVAAHLSSGRAFSELGTSVSDLVRLSLPQPARTADGLKGEIIHIDHFGNAASNIRIEHILELLPPASSTSEGSEESRLRARINTALEHKERYTVLVSGLELKGLVSTFGERAPGEPIALFGSTGNLIASVVNGSFAGEYPTRPGDPIELRLQP